MEEGWCARFTPAHKNGWLLDEMVGYNVHFSDRCDELACDAVGCCCVYLCPGCEAWSVESEEGFYQHPMFHLAAEAAAHEHRAECRTLDVFAGLAGVHMGAPTG